MKLASVATDVSKAGEQRSASGELATDSLAVGISFFVLLSVLQRLVGFGRSIVFCHLMTDDQLGRWSLAFSFLMLASPLAVLGLPGTFGRYFEYFRSRGQAHAFLRRILVLTALLAIGFLSVVWLAPEQVSWILLGTSEHAGLVRNLTLALATVIVFNVAVELAVAMRQIRLVSIVQFVQSLLFAGFACLMLAATSLADSGVVLGYTLSAAVAAAVAVGYLLSRVRVLAPDSCRLDGGLWQRLLPFAGWLWVSNTLFNLFDTVDRLMIVHFAAPEVSTDALVGQYHSSRIVPALLVALSGMLAGVILPYLSEDWEQGRRRRASQRTVLAVKTCALLYVFGGGLVLLASPILFDSLLQGRYDAGLRVLPGTLVYCIWFGLMILTENHLLCAERVRASCFALLLGLIVNITLNSILLPWYGLAGAIAATALANAVGLIATLLMASFAGLRCDRGTWLAISLPLVLLLGWQLTFACLFFIGLLCTRRNFLFDTEERGVLARVVAHWRGFCGRFGIRD